MRIDGKTNTFIRTYFFNIGIIFTCYCSYMMMTMTISKTFTIFSALILIASTCLGWDLAPHEEKLYQAFNNITVNTDQIKALHAPDAVVTLACGKDKVRSGRFDDVLMTLLPHIEYFITKIDPITSTNDTHPDHGIFTFKWIGFMKTKKGCEDIFSGFAFVKVSNLCVSSLFFNCKCFTQVLVTKLTTSLIQMASLLSINDSAMIAIK